MTESRHEARRRCDKWRVCTQGASRRPPAIFRQISVERWRGGCGCNKGEDESEGGEMVVQVRVCSSASSQVWAAEKASSVVRASKAARFHATAEGKCAKSRGGLRPVSPVAALSLLLI